MLINFTQNFLSDLEKVSDDFVDHLEDLILQHTRNNHYIAATRIITNSISKCLKGRLSARAEATLSQIASQSADSQHLLSKVIFHVEINTCKTTGVILENRHGKKVWVCDVHFASKWCSQPLRIVGENITDGDASLEACRHFSIANSFDVKMRKAHVDQSGGCGSADVVLGRRIKDAASPVLCVIDSDKLYPTHNGSPAIKKCEEAITNGFGVAALYVSPTREIENLLPFEFIEHAIESTGSCATRDTEISNLKLLKELQKKGQNIYQYVDLKMGTCQTSVRKDGQAVFEHYVKHATIMDTCECKDNCDGLYSPPIRKNLLELVVKKMQECSKREIEGLLSTESTQNWLELGEMVFSMALANHLRLT